MIETNIDVEQNNNKLEGDNSGEASLSPKKSQLKNHNQKYKTRARPCSDCFSEYSSNASIHCVQYIGETNRPIFERVFWCFVLSISICCCFCMIYNLWRKWNDTPVLVSFNDRETEIWRIPFPSITVCPQAKISSKVLNYDEIVKMPPKNLTHTQKTLLRALANICELEYFDPSIRANQTEKINLIGVMENIGPMVYAPPPSVIRYNKIEQMTPVLTNEGICFNFNGIHLGELFNEKSEIPKLNYSNMEAEASDWDRENGYKNGAGLHAYPRRILGSGIKLGITILLATNKHDISHKCSTPADGFKVLINSPDNFPESSEGYLTVQSNQHVLGSIRPSMLWTSQELNNYSPNARQCYFNKEKPLTYFSRYTKSNCELECLTKFTYERCGCVKFSMPRSNDMEICQSWAEIDCYSQAQDDFLNLQVESEVSHNSRINFKESCNCLPPCTSINYNTEISQTQIDFQKYSDAVFGHANGTELNSVDVTLVTLFFAENSFLTSKRSELYGISEFTANCGGLFGLFMGMSVISLFEIFYFSVIREITNFIRRRNRQEWL